MNEIKPDTELTPFIFLRNVLIKTGLLFLAANLIFAVVHPVPILAKFSLYNHLFPGRVRLPFGENPQQAYNFSLFELDAMLRSHILAGGSKPADEFRILMLGDSSVWGYLLRPDETLSAVLNAAQITTPQGKQVRFYNLGYPTLSLAKDFLLLSKAAAYQPDMIIWLVTLESFPTSNQTASPIVQHNPNLMRELISRYGLEIDPNDPNFVMPTFWEQTIVGQRRSLADLLRLQAYGVMWAATGIDQYYPEEYTRPQNDLEADAAFHGIQPPQFKEGDLAFDVLNAGKSMIGEIPILVVNEPIFISDGENSNIRYNFFYPRWAYDEYRQLLALQSRAVGWELLDEWNLIPPQEFTNTAIHMTPAATADFARQIQAKVSTMLPGASQDIP